MGNVRVELTHGLTANFDYIDQQLGIAERIRQQLSPDTPDHVHKWVPGGDASGSLRITHWTCPHCGATTHSSHDFRRHKLSPEEEK
jgi:hypothetical protein